MPDFEGTKAITLQPDDSAIPYRFEWTICSASTNNDGALPYGHSLSSVVTECHRVDGTVVTTGIVSASSMTVNVLTLWLGYPASSDAQLGRHHLTFAATISDGTTTYTREFDFNRLYVKDR